MDPNRQALGELSPGKRKWVGRQEKPTKTGENSIFY